VNDGGPLAGKVIIVTGAGAGLGRAYTHALVGLGAAVVANDIDAVPLADAVAEANSSAGASAGSAEKFAKTGGGRAVAVAADVTESATGDLLVATALERFGRLDGVVANAGVLRSGPLLGLSDLDISVVLDTHVVAAFRLLRAAGAHWRAEFKAGRPVEGSVVLTTSSAGLYGFRGESIYSAAKGALASLTLVAADEFARFGVTVNAVAPAARTRLTSWLGETEAPPAEDPLSPAHVAPVVAWLLLARDITGRVVEAGNAEVSVAQGWRAGPGVTLPPRAGPEAIDEVMRRAFEAAAPPVPIQRATAPAAQD
jgi:NAD(P)-dependent dehydrogenase (short-subunit alcohol dehydrogenase family)